MRWRRRREKEWDREETESHLGERERQTDRVLGTLEEEMDRGFVRKIGIGFFSYYG